MRTLEINPFPLPPNSLTARLTFSQSHALLLFRITSPIIKVQGVKFKC
jgi:hypothetical protein